MKTMKKAKAPSAKTLARKAKEAAMIAWAKQQHAQFRADLREMFAKEKRELGDPGGTGGKTARLVPQAPGLENKPRLSDLLLGDAEKKADGMLAQLRRSREQEVARAKAMARADAARRPGGPGGTGITTGRNQVAAASLAVQKVKAVSAVSPAAMRYIDERGTVRGKLSDVAADKTQVNHTLANVKQSVRYQRGITDVYLLFNGQSLSIINTKDNVILRSFTAVSGREEDGRFDYSRERQRMKGAGPLPEGEYYVDMNELQKITLWEEMKGTFARGHWPGSRISWGSQRAWLKPEEVVIDGVKRDKLSIHGGAEYGSAGCIDLRHNAAAFFDALKYYLQNIPSKKVKLIVKYR